MSLLERHGPKGRSHSWVCCSVRCASFFQTVDSLPFRLNENFKIRLWSNRKLAMDALERLRVSGHRLDGCGKGSNK